MSASGDFAPAGLRIVASLMQVVTDVAKALAYLHGRCICHGDVYAHNVLARTGPGDDGAAVLCDYGAPLATASPLLTDQLLSEAVLEVIQHPESAQHFELPRARLRVRS